MRLQGIYARRPSRFRKTTNSDHDDPIAPNIIERNFTATASNQIWVGDITYVWTAAGWLYLAVLIDISSRRVVGWALAITCETRS
jgi:transposase InsO family protein